MSHDFHVLCQCGEPSGEWNIQPKVLVDSVKQSAILRDLRKTGWGEDFWSLGFKGHELNGLAAFLCSHFDHGGFSVVGEYKSDIPIPCRPDIDPAAYKSICLDRVKEEIEAIEKKLAILKVDVARRNG